MSRQYRIVIGFALPLLLIGGGALWAIKSRAGNQESIYLQNGTTYAVWVSEVYMTDRHADGRAWDSDGSGPDLRAELYWGEHRVLTTPVSEDNLVGRWDSVSIDLGSVLAERRISSEQVRNVASIKPESNKLLKVLVHDEDVVDDEFAGGVSLAVTNLVVGLNRIIVPSNQFAEIRSIELAVSPYRADTGLSLDPDVVALDFSQPVIWIPPVLSASTDARVDELSQAMDESVKQGALFLEEALAEGTRIMEESARELRRMIDYTRSGTTTSAPSPEASTNAAPPPVQP